jgi:hypothetical protein
VIARIRSCGAGLDAVIFWGMTSSFICHKVWPEPNSSQLCLVA